MNPIETTTEHERAESARLITEALDDGGAPAATFYRDPNPPAPTGAQPVAQPGRPPMSQRATDISGVITATGLASLPIGGGAALVLWQLSHVSPTVLAIAGLAPIGLVGAVGKALGRTAKEVAEAAPAEHHHHYEGPATVQHTEVHTESRWFGRTTNQLTD
jgi:hypothetical protein